ncbi:nucleotide exchange factor GrpE [Candidatus Gottesmanbacteria bacterium RBG_16_52_11]|uniref:Protein GrpE n=1 Tax=Candidatus Gottesmanbacteria bacterium RBG_16_52_11 TaxID=1798374 RepID=A0A1F5YN21_9BACT|nr:MAG: nucleotide exchange factor GrpE [Candidatus Gottesmanbacteria bacterium RBG_16_52_11]
MLMKKQDQTKKDNQKAGADSGTASLADWKAHYLRALADYRNLEKRTVEESDRNRKFASETVIRKLLPIYDALESAERHLKDPGLTLVYRQVGQLLSEQGVERIAVLGKNFDPELMECIETTANHDNTVIAEMLPGYRMHGRLLRAARVKVGKLEKSVQ